MKFSILPFLVSGMIFSNVVLADEFSDALFSLKTEARAQANYFGGLIEEYREMADQGKIKIENVSIVIQISANESQQSRLFWLALEKSFETLLEQYSKITENSLDLKRSYESSSIQKSIQFLLQQVNRSAYMAFRNLTATFKELKFKRRFRAGLANLGDPQILNNPWKQMLTLLEEQDEKELEAEFLRVLRQFQQNPSSNPHLDLNIDDMTTKYKLLYKGFESYRRYFTDFRTLFSIYHYLHSFYADGDPIECFPSATLMEVQNTWTDQIASLNIQYLPTFTDPRRYYKKKNELDFQREDNTYPLEGNFIAPKVVEEQWLTEQLDLIHKNFSEWVDLDVKERRKNLKNRKKKEKKKRNKASEKQAQLASSSTSIEEAESLVIHSQSSSSFSAYEEKARPKDDLTKLDIDLLQNDSVRSLSEPKFEKTTSALETNTPVVEMEDDEYGISYLDYLALIKNEKQKTLEKIQQTRASALSSNSEESQPSKITLTGGAAKIYLTAMGLDNSKVRNRDLQQFLNQVGVYFVKCTGRQSDPKIALPNFNEDTISPFWVDKMHLMHSGTEHFPISRLRTHLYRMIIESRLNHFVKVDI